MSKQIRDLFSNVNGANFISIDTETIPKLTGGKKNPMQGAIRKVTIGSNVMVFSNKSGSAYGAMVERRLRQEGKDPASFQLSERAWGTRVEGTPIIEHHGETYIEVIFLKSGKTHYLHGVRPINKAEIEGMPADHGESEQGGLENKVIIRTIKADSIKRVVIDGQVHTF
jgi:hypothetical protein